MFKKYFRNTIRESNSLDPVQNFGPDLGQTVCKGYQQTTKQRVEVGMVFRKGEYGTKLINYIELQTNGLCKRDEKKSLGSFELQLIAVQAQIMSNNDIEAKVILKDTIMDDMRPLKKEGINRLVTGYVNCRVIVKQ